MIVFCAGANGGEADEFVGIRCYDVRLAKGGDRMSFGQRLQDVKTGFERAFWVANISEMFERLSYYAAFAVLGDILARIAEFSDGAGDGPAGLFGGLVWFSGDFWRSDRRSLRFPARAFASVPDSRQSPTFLMGSLGASWLAPVGDVVPLVVLVPFVLVLPPLGVAW